VFLNAARLATTQSSITIHSESGPRTGFAALRNFLFVHSQFIPKEGKAVIDASPSSEFSKELIGQVEYLIQQSIRGHHFLFDVDTLRQILSPARAEQFSQNLSEEEALAIEGHIETLIRQPTLSHKRAYLDSLNASDPGTYAWVVKTYFNIIENNLLETQEVRH
jgi:hypothetical protein